MKLSLINVFRNVSFKKLDWLPDLFFGIGFFVTLFIIFWFEPNLYWLVLLSLPILIGLAAEGLFIVIYAIYVFFKNNNYEIKYHKFDKEDDKSYTTSKSNERYIKF